MQISLAIANIGILVANLILICLIYKQVRYIYKPLITTKLVSREASVDDTPSVLIASYPYLVVSNTSTNRATKVVIHFEFWLRSRKIVQMDKSLHHLNPKEAIKELIPIGEVASRYPELFEEIERGKEMKRIPLETLEIILRIVITHGLFREKVIDSYKIEWGSLKSYPQFEGHPIVNCWNMRDGTYIYKLKS